jgi:hypothetical protein
MDEEVPSGTHLLRSGLVTTSTKLKPEDASETSVLLVGYSLAARTDNRSNYLYRSGRAVAQAVSRQLPIAVALVRAGSGRVEFVVDKLALGQVSFYYFGFTCQSLFHRLLHTHLLHHPGLVQ